METEFTLVASSVVANSSSWSQRVLNKGGLLQHLLPATTRGLEDEKHANKSKTTYLPSKLC